MYTNKNGSVLPELINYLQESLKKEKFPEIWKKANVVPVHKKEDKTIIENYLPISLLPIFAKFLEVNL